MRFLPGPRVRVLIAAIAAMIGIGSPTLAQSQIVGRCVAPAFNASYAFMANGLIVQEQNPSNQGMAMRDPSGQTFLRLPSLTPQITAYFVAWNGALVEVNYQYGMRQVGGCQFNMAYVPPNPFVGLWHQPQMAPGFGIQTPQGSIPVPQQLADASNGFASPRLVSEGQAGACFQQASSSGGVDRSRFGQCLLQYMATPDERALLECARSSDRTAIVFCMVGQLGGQREQAAAAALQNCYRQYGSDYSRYPLCMASGNVPGEAGKLLACVEQQSRTGNVTMTGTAICYGAGSIRMNPETQIIVSCAVATGGEPYSFAGCAGGQLTTRELDKCFTNGIGGNGGCFGPNNDIVRALNGTGQWLAGQFGPNNDLVRTWNNTVNDIRYGPGPNHEASRAIRNVGNEISRGNENVKREVKKVLKNIFG